MMKSVSEDPPDCTVQGYPSCYVCGTPACAVSILFVCQPAPGKCFFPFLETHEPPENSQPINDGKVLACNLCAQLLQAQWQNYELDKTPLVKRIYWLKRDDGMAYSGVEMGMQTEYASQFLGLAPDPVPVDDRVSFGSRPSRAVLTGLPNSLKLVAPNSSSNSTCKSNFIPQSSSQQTSQLIQIIPKSNAATTVCNVHPTSDATPIVDEHYESICQDFAPEPQEEALDLSVGRKKVTKRPHSCEAGNSPPEVLDLSMPDKNASTEVCYVCGDHYSRGILTEMFAKEQSCNQPFFPSLMCHARPSKSHPMAASGCVQGCKSCFDFLQTQWLFFNSKEVDHKYREYLLEKPSKSIDGSLVVCHECRELVDVKKGRILFTYNDENKYIPDVEKRQSLSECQFAYKTAKIICSICCSKHHFDNSSDASNETIDICVLFSPEPKRRRVNNTIASSGTGTNVFSTTMMPLSLQADLVEESTVACYLCHHLHASNCMHWISMLQESASPEGMFFSFIKNIHRVSSGIISEDGKVLACSLCYQHLKRQWNEFEAKKVAVDRRIFSCRAPSLGSMSPRQTPNMSPLYGFDSQSNEISHLLKQSDTESRSINQEEAVKALKLLEVDMTKENGKSSYALPSISNQNPVKIPSNCYICGFTSKAGETYVVSSKKHGYSKMSFPFLDAHATTYKPASIGNSNYLICTFCFHTLAQQWQQFEKQQVDCFGRFYDTYNFTCYVCTLKTYRRRLRKLNVQHFPFLRDHVRPPGALSVENGHAVAVCKDCHTRLIDQYNDMEKCGVPIERREYNWIKKPAPPQYPSQQAVFTAPVQAYGAGAAAFAAPVASSRYITGIEGSDGPQRPSSAGPGGLVVTSGQLLCGVGTEAAMSRPSGAPSSGSSSGAPSGEGSGEEATLALLSGRLRTGGAVTVDSDPARAGGSASPSGFQWRVSATPTQRKIPAPRSPLIGSLSPQRSPAPRSPLAGSPSPQRSVALLGSLVPPALPPPRKRTEKVPYNSRKILAVTSTAQSFADFST